MVQSYVLQKWPIAIRTVISSSETPHDTISYTIPLDTKKSKEDHSNGKHDTRGHIITVPTDEPVNCFFTQKLGVGDYINFSINHIMSKNRLSIPPMPNMNIPIFLCKYESTHVQLRITIKVNFQKSYCYTII